MKPLTDDQRLAFLLFCERDHKLFMRLKFCLNRLRTDLRTCTVDQYKEAINQAIIETYGEGIYTI